MIIGRHDFYPDSGSDAPKRQIPINISSLKSSISHLHQPASNLEHPASPNPIESFPENDATSLRLLLSHLSQNPYFRPCVLFMMGCVKI